MLDSAAPGLGPCILAISYSTAFFSQLTVLFLPSKDLQILCHVISWAHLLIDMSFWEPHAKVNSRKLSLNF